MPNTGAGSVVPAPAYADLERAQNALNQAQQAMQVLKACKGNCEQQEQQHAQLQEQLTAIMQTFYPSGRGRKK